MGLFGRRHQHEATSTISQPVPAQQVVVSATSATATDGEPATLRVIAVGTPALDDPGAALVTGLLLGSFGVQLVQVTVGLPVALRPVVGQDLPAVANRIDPMQFAVAWASTDQPSTAPVRRLSGPGGWDAGIGGAHDRDVVEWLAANGFLPGDFGPALALYAPELPARLTQACSRYVSLVTGPRAMALMRTGEPAQAVIREVRRLPMPVQLLPSPQACLAWLTLEVTPYQREPYRTTIRFGFRSPERFAALGSVGITVPVRIDRTDPTDVMIDLPALGINPQ